MSRPVFGYVFALALVLFVPSLGAAAGVATAARARKVTVEDFFEEPISQLARLTPARARKLREVIREDVKTFKSDWVADEMVEMRTLVLDGVTLTFAVHRSIPAFLVSATFTGAGWTLPGNLGVGASADRIVQILGKGEVNGDVITYCTDEAPSFVQFTVKNGVVVAVKLTPYTG